MTKEYISTAWSGLNVSLRINGKCKIVKFLPRPKHVGGCTYTTTDEEVQEALEESELFADGTIKLEGSFGPAGQATETDNAELFPEQQLKEYPEVTRLAEAANILADEYGVDASSIRRKAQIIDIAKQYGVSFPKLK